MRRVTFFNHVIKIKPVENMLLMRFDIQHSFRACFPVELKYVFTGLKVLHYKRSSFIFANSFDILVIQLIETSQSFQLFYLNTLRKYNFSV